MNNAEVRDVVADVMADGHPNETTTAHALWRCLTNAGFRTNVRRVRAALNALKAEGLLSRKGRRYGLSWVAFDAQEKDFDAFLVYLSVGGA